MGKFPKIWKNRIFDHISLTSNLPEIFKGFVLTLTSPTPKADLFLGIRWIPNMEGMPHHFTKKNHKTHEIYLVYPNVEVFFPKNMCSKIKVGLEANRIIWVDPPLYQIFETKPLWNSRHPIEWRTLSLKLLSTCTPRYSLSLLVMPTPHGSDGKV